MRRKPVPPFATALAFALRGTARDSNRWSLWNEPGEIQQDRGRDRARHHGRLVLAQSCRGRMAGDRLRHRRGKAQGIGQGRRRDRASAKAVAAAAPIIITSLPKPEALAATAKEIAGAKLPRRIIAECSTFTIEDKEKAEKILRAAGHVMLDCPVSGTRLAGAHWRSGDLRQRRSRKPRRRPDRCLRVFAQAL